MKNKQKIAIVNELTYFIIVPNPADNDNITEFHKIL